MMSDLPKKIKKTFWLYLIVASCVESKAYDNSNAFRFSGSNAISINLSVSLLSNSSGVIIIVLFEGYL